MFVDHKKGKEIALRKLAPLVYLEWQPYNKVNFIFASNIAVLVGWDKFTQMVIKCLKHICYAIRISTIKFKNMLSVANLLVYS